MVVQILKIDDDVMRGYPGFYGNKILVEKTCLNVFVGSYGVKNPNPTIQHLPTLTKKG